MSDLRIRSIDIKSFKAFQNFSFKLNGRHLLAYGGNGAGKSSLYWSLYTFLQSAQKDATEVTKYFDKDRPENLLNLYSSEPENAAITLMLQNADASSCPSLTISATQHGTAGDTNIIKGNLASDFITYRVLFSFYQFRNSQVIDLWPVFEQEMLPFCRSTTLIDVGKHWKELQDAKPFETGQAAGENGAQIKKRYLAFDAKVEQLNVALNEILSTITDRAQEFYDQHFAEPNLPLIELRVGLTVGASDYDRKTHSHSPPVIGFGVKIGAEIIHKPHTFLNEAKLTQLALAVRFGATLAHLQDSPVKLLVLDDLLISLDMGNRMKVVDIILGETFADYQKIILTHDQGFFNEFRRRIGDHHTNWSFQNFKSSATTGVGFSEAKTPLQKADDHLRGHNLDEAAVCLRKAAEDTAKRYREFSEGRVLPPGEFFSLTDNLRAARNKLIDRLPSQLYVKILKSTPLALRPLIVSAVDADIDHNLSLSPEERGRLKKQRSRLRQLMSEEDWKKMDMIESIDRVLSMTDRVLNPAAHGSAVPLYQEEVARALAMVSEFESSFRQAGAG